MAISETIHWGAQCLPSPPRPPRSPRSGWARLRLMVSVSRGRAHGPAAGRLCPEKPPPVGTAHRGGAPRVGRLAIEDRGRDGDCSPPPAQIPASGTTALGSYLGWVTAKRWSG